jgi:hypothetical protein
MATKQHKATVEHAPEPDNDDNGGLSDLQKDQITGLVQKFKWGSAQVADIARAVKASEEEDVRRFLAPPQKPTLDVGALIDKVRNILQTADYDQVSLTHRYMDAGRHLHELKAICQHGEFEKLLALSFPDRSLSTLHEYMALAKGFDAADDPAKVQLAGLFKHGWKAVLEEIRRLKRRPKKPAPLIIPARLQERMQIIHGNCLDILPTITEPHILISDPPYNQGIGYDGYDDALPPDEYRNMLIKVFGGKKAVIIMYPEEIINLLGGGALRECLEVVAWVYPSNTTKQHRLVTWWNCKPDLTRLGQPYRNPNDKRIVKLIEEGCEARSYDWWGNIHQVKNVSKDHDHPCPIPVELARRIILTTTEPGDRIVDPFCGSGTIPAVAAALGRYAIGIEQSEKYCEIAKARLGTIEEELGLKDETVFAEAAE